jgi:hypothetical protein
MATGRMRRGALRGAAALVLGCLTVLGGLVAFAPSASADPAVTVYVRDLTPPLVSVDQFGTVTFINQIQDKSTGVSLLGLAALTATVHTDITLALPSGQHPLKAQSETDPNPEPGSSWKEQFKQSCLTCTITYGYRVSFSAPVASNLVGQLTTQALQRLQMPQSKVVTYNGQQMTVQIGVPTPFIVNTLVPLPNLPSVNLPNLPQVNVPLPGVPGAVNPPSVPGTSGVSQGTTTITTTTTTTTLHGIDGSLYAYDTGNGAPQLAPEGAGSAAFDSSRVSGNDSSARFLAGGAGGIPGVSDSGSSGVYGLDGTKLADASAQSPARSGSPLTIPALVAVVCLAGAFAALVRTAQRRRAHR